jgi:hypothetical protein
VIPGDAIKRIAVTMSETIAEPVCEQAIPCPLQFGPMYGSGSEASGGSSPQKPPGSPTAAGSSSSSAAASAAAVGAAPTSGYFELVNKSEGFVCAKVIMGGNFINELSRPSFLSVGPQTIVSGNFDPAFPEITLMILVDNPNELTPAGSNKCSYTWRFTYFYDPMTFIVTFLQRTRFLRVQRSRTSGTFWYTRCSHWDATPC